ncbi:hypothetical protein VTO42DRAFT_7943 [Malbranchea cinnamomea]
MRTLRPSPVACTECRKQHLRCDAKKPSCSRCVDGQLTCIYLPSRRGGKRKREASIASEAVVDRQPPKSQVVPGDAVSVSADDRPSPDGRGHAHGHQREPSTGSSLGPPASLPEQPYVPDSRLIRLYYENFHPAHPILVPPSLYEARNYPRYLQQVVKFIGSQYSVVLPKNVLLEETALELSTSTERTPCMVQALLLYSIIMFARNEFSQADVSLTRATDIALELGMYQKQFATTFAGDQEPEPESLRRTWWELFVTEVYMATLQQKVHLRCGEVPYDVLLPCEENLYVSRDSIPRSPPSLDSFATRVFTEDDDDADACRYSSYCYRIEAVRILARVLVLNSLPETHQDHQQALANAIVSWMDHLPRHKIDVVDMYGNVDEMLFQAHVTIHYAAMLLHLPRSDLRPRFPDLGLRICPVTPVRLSPSLTRHVHDVKATEASKKLSNLLSVRPSAQGYSPFSTPSLVLCGLVQLATSERHSSECSDHHYNRVILVLGCLKLLKQKWSLAREAHSYLRRAASQVITTRQQEFAASQRSSSTSLAPTTLGQDNPGHWASWNLSPGAEATNNEFLTPMLLSAYMDPTCSDPFPLNRMSTSENV